ncbi:hypothetical protein [Dokdonella sp.]|uniref:hypothetical protein n=1 Tax=Dokdonella sp. TaxID=2291710 RepID=UPI0025C370C4|nr:hypothetical protein [Dokdonella sp.]MBX3692465.1 hypothetical protein [Dokdonella sp.]MCW5568989.1 hypothetical protein [Dokdonella sp.]
MIAYLFAWILPVFAGAGVYALLNRDLRGPGAVCAAIGYGFFIGLFLAAFLAGTLAGAQISATFARVAPWLAAIGIAAWIAAWYLRSRHVESTGKRLSTTARVIIAVAVLLVLLRLWILAAEASLRPVFPWDAWSAWSVKPKTWYLLDRFVAWVDPAAWLAAPAGATRTSAVWNYPELLAWIEVWFASAAGGWIEPRIGLAWTGALAALGLVSYGQWRGIGIDAVLAAVLAYALVSLPLVDAHAALAGYADLWLAAVFGLAVLAWLRWLRRGGIGQLILALAFALCLPLIKLEGAVWLLILSVVGVFAALPSRWRWKLAAVAALLVVVGLGLGGFVFPMLGLGWVGIQWGEVVVPALGAIDLRWRPGGLAMLAGLFTLPNWHLLWYLAPALVAWRWRQLIIDPASARVATMLLVCLAFLCVLFFFTDAAAWAENHTSANRLVLHFVPAVFSLLALLLAPVVDERS